jgi:L-rhamnose-H+ transport protein
MTPSPMLGVIFHAIGGFAAGSFYAPTKKIRGWHWESAWMILGLVAWLITPWTVAFCTVPHLLDVLQSSPPAALFLAFFFGLLWGIGGLTFGLALRYLGVGLGMTVALGFCMAFGTLIPPIASGEIINILQTLSGWVVLFGVGVSLLGIILCGKAGMAKERELTNQQKEESVQEFAFGKGMIVAVVSGILSSCMSYGITAGKPIAHLAAETGANSLLVNNASMAVILFGGLLTNVTWCLVLNFKNRSFNDYRSGPWPQQLCNYLLAAMAGFVWYNQFFFYGMGETNMGDAFKFSSWSIHMAFIIVFSNLWGIFFHEWKGTSRKARWYLTLGIMALILSTIIIGLGNC